MKKYVTSSQAWVVYIRHSVTVDPGQTCHSVALLQPLDRVSPGRALPVYYVGYVVPTLTSSIPDLKFDLKDPFHSHSSVTFYTACFLSI